MSSHLTSPAVLYIADINGSLKFGITIDWKSRVKKYKSDFGDVPITKMKEFPFDFYWQAELVEQVMVHRLRPFTRYGTREWIEFSVPIQIVLDCFHHTRKIMEQEYHLHEMELLNAKQKYRTGYYEQLIPLLNSKFKQE